MNNNSKTAGILIIILGVIILASVIGFAYFTYINTPVHFDPQRRAAATRLFESVMNTDLVNDYPRTPQEVMRYFLDISRLIYSGMIVNEDLYPALVAQMRNLLGPELLMLNSFEEQLATVMDSVAVFAELGIFQTGWEQLPPLFDTADPTVAYIRATQSFNTGETFYWLYSFERVIPGNEWRIVRFDRTDENFNVIR